MGQALDQPGHQQHHRRPDADGGEGRRDADHEAAQRREAHRQRHGRLAADAVADPAEQETPDRPCHEADGEDRQRCQHRRGRIRFAEQLAGDVGRERGVDGPVVPFDGVPDPRAEEGLPGTEEGTKMPLWEVLEMIILLVVMEQTK